MLGHEEKTVSPQESMFLLRGGPRYPPLSLSLFKKIFLVFIATGEWALSLPHPFFFPPIVGMVAGLIFHPSAVGCRAAGALS